jgi:1-aminocyclopropane-1-carboxylate deaminase/D-cysteine desulfhydrase-like pyridoxal-dependent ACC family enzyme
VDDIVQGDMDRGEITTVVPEGCSGKEAVVGTLTLAWDVMRNEMEGEVEFDHIFVDAGTGMVSMGLIMGLEMVGHGAMVHVVPMAGEEEYREAMDKYRPWYRNLVQKAEDEGLVRVGEAQFPKGDRVRIWPLLQDRSFGSVSKSLLKYIKQFVMQHGVFLDPIYSAKMVERAVHAIQEEELSGNILLIHSGGALALTGYLHRLI